jgi:hypothetical protein
VARAAEGGGGLGDGESGEPPAESHCHFVIQGGARRGGVSESCCRPWCGKWSGELAFIGWHGSAEPARVGGVDTG